MLAVPSWFAAGVAFSGTQDDVGRHVIQRRRKKMSSHALLLAVAALCSMSLVARWRLYSYRTGQLRRR